MTTEAEIAQRNKYWFEHWREFTMDVVVSVPVERSGFVGGNMGHLFGAAPIPFNSQTTDRGRFEIQEDGTVWVYASRQTYAWNLNSTHVMYFIDGSGVEMRCANQPVIVIRGPVASPIAGYFTEHGISIS